MSTQLEDLVPGAVIGGVVPAKDVTSVALSWHGGAAVALTYRDPDGRVGERLLYRSDEEALSIRGARVRWSFDADGELFSLVSEARRIRGWVSPLSRCLDRNNWGGASRVPQNLYGPQR